ncbi:MAG TPA: serine/threonine protein kinase [Planctomycetaceae bacterium]|nr:serine/threonine protein kinase [Planctomycetaceae bacterium]
MSDSDREQRIVEWLKRLADLPLEEAKSVLEREGPEDAAFRHEVLQRLASHRTSPPTEAASAGHAGAEEADPTRTLGENITSSKSAGNGRGERNLLFGILAVQMDFVTRDQLIKAMNAWILQKDTPLGEILVQQRALDRTAMELVDAVVQKHLEQHGNKPAQSLASLSSVTDLKKELEGIPDEDVRQSVFHLQPKAKGAAEASTLSMVGTPSQPGRRFRILRPHRRGGLGAVYVARDEELNRDVALKEVLDRFKHHAVAHTRLKVEAEITGGLEHPGIVPVYGLGNYPDGRPFYCMRFVHGDSLSDAIADFRAARRNLSATESRLRLRHLLQRLIDVCEAVAYAHSRQVLHRDLKPGNIMLGRYGETLVVDWGLAKALGTEETMRPGSDRPLVPRSGSTAAPTELGTTIGTPEYMSPEQAQGRLDELGPATDVFSLGATLYCLLTGQAPYHSEAEDKDQRREEILRQAKEHRFVAPRELDPTIPRPLEAICLKAMARDPAERYVSPSDLAEDIERWLADERVSAFPEPWWTRAGRVIRKNRTAAMTLSAIVLTALIGLAILNVVTHRKNIVIAAQRDELAVAKKRVEESRARIAAQRDELAVAKKRVEESRARLDATYQQFRKATGSLIRLAERELSQDPKLADLRKIITNEAFSLFQDLVGTEANRSPVLDDPSLAVWYAGLYRYSANMDRQTGNLPMAVDKFEKAVDLLRQVRQSHPDHIQALVDLSAAVRDLGTTLRTMGQLREAQAALAEALRLDAKIQETAEQTISSRFTAGANFLDAAAVSYQIGDYESTVKYTAQAAHILRNLVEKHETKGQVEPIFLLVLALRSHALRNLGRVPEAQACIQEGIERIEARTEKPTTRAVRHTTARIYLEQAYVILAADGDLAAARTSADRAVALWQTLAKEYPDFRSYRRYLVSALEARAHTAMKRQQFEEAQGDLQKARKLFEAFSDSDLADPDILRTYGEVWTRSAQVELALEHPAEAAKLANQALQRLEEAREKNPAIGTFDEVLKEARRVAKEAEAKGP